MHYRTILADPPWPEHGGGKSKRGADRHYQLMSVRKIAALPVGELADPAGCHLWMWATGNYLADAIDCGRAWGFRYINFRPWVKVDVVRARALADEEHPDAYIEIQTLARPQRVGLGKYLRCDAEIMLLFVRGKLPLPSYKPRQTIYAPRGRHSAKPLIVHEQIEQMSPGPRIELFTRQKREGWHAWGNEVQSDIELPREQTRLAL